MKAGLLICAAVGMCLLAAEPAAAAVVLQDAMQGSTSGVRSGGAFVADGWKVTGKSDCIIWHIPSLTAGAIEWSVKGLNSRECRVGMQDHSEVFHMYDYTWNNADSQYNPGYRDNPYKHFVRKSGAGYWAGDPPVFVDCRGHAKTDSMEILWLVCPVPAGCTNYLEGDTAVLSWNPDVTYVFREEWEPSGVNSVLRTYRNGVLLLTQAVAGPYAPGGVSIRIGASPRGETYAGAPIDAVFSGLTVWDSTCTTPNAPTVNAPANGETVNTRTVFIRWSGSGYSQFQVQVNTVNAPDASVAWDSGQVASSQAFAWTGQIQDQTNYYVFVRLGNCGVWGPWSAAGRWFRVDSWYVPPGQDVARLNGSSLCQKSGPYLGLGASYFSALRFCKFDRTRLNSDLAFLASNDFNYVRILSMVAWDGMEIAPVSFTNCAGHAVSAWSDYWQQLRDLIDLVYSHGMRTQVVCFADAQCVMPNKSTRLTHLDNLLSAIKTPDATNPSGREHKVVLIEVANEAWQNGFAGSTGIAELCEFGQYLGARTPVLIALSSPDDTTDAGISRLYACAGIDIATVHFSRDTGPAGGWQPVYDCYRTGLIGVPPMSSNEPIGPGSSVNSETDPCKLVMAAALAWGANLPMYVFHSRAGVQGVELFQNQAGIGSFARLNELLPPELAGWVRNDGKEAAAPFTSYCNGQANKWWPEVSGATSGVVRHTGSSNGNKFVTLPIGILGGGVELEARRPMWFQVFDPLTGAVVADMTRNMGEHFMLVQGPRAYIIRGSFTDVVGPRTEVTVDLGSPDVQNGMTHPQNADGDTVAISLGGRTCRENVNPAEDFYFYLSVDDSFVLQGSKPDVYITVEYYDSGTATLNLQYDGTSGAYESGGSVTRTGGNTWKYATFHVTDAYFGNRQNAGADLRIGDVGHMFALDVIRVSTEQPAPPVIADVVPDPDTGAKGVEYVRQLALAQGSPAPSWSIVQAPSGTQVTADGRVKGWVPQAADIGLFTFEIQASNFAGSDTESWQVRVYSGCDFDHDGDVDQTDFGHLQACLHGDGFTYPEGCGDADLDGDLDVDATDFNRFHPCVGGPDGGPGC